MKSKTDKIAVLSGFCEIKCGGNSSDGSLSCLDYMVMALSNVAKTEKLVRWMQLESPDLEARFDGR